MTDGYSMFGNEVRVNHTVYGMLLIASACSLLTFVLMCVVVAGIGPILHDASGTLSDVQWIIPEVNASLMILKRLCASDVFHEYCE